MGFLDKLFGKKEETAEVKKEELLLNFSEVPVFVDDFYKKSFSEIDKEIFSRFSEIKHLVKELELQLNELEALEIKENEGNRKLRKIVSTSKKTLINKMRVLQSKLIPVASTDFIELNSYCTNSLNLLESEINSFGRNIAYTGIVLKEPIKKLGEKINELKSVFIKTKELFDSKKGLVLFPEIKETVSGLKKTIESNADSLKLEKEILNKVSLAEKEIGFVELELKKLQNSNEVIQLNKLFEEKKNLAVQKQGMKSKLIELFYPIDKLLRVFGKMVEAKRFPLSKEEESLLVSYSSNPFIALKKDNNALTLKKFFGYIKELVLTNKISLKEKEKAKKLSVLDELIKYDFFGEVFWKFNEIEKKSIEIESKINSLDISSKMSSLNERISSFKNSKQENLRETERQQNTSKKLSFEANNSKNELEKKLSDFSGKTIVLSLKQ